MYKVLSISAILLFLVCCVVRIVGYIGYEQEVGGYLKLAADANSIELAERNLEVAVSGMERRNLCNGGGNNCFTSVLWRTPDEDVGYWRENIEGTLKDLQAMTPEERSNNLVESNQLIKVRETILDDGGSSGTQVTSPMGISVFPNNMIFGVLGLLSCLLACLFGAMWIFTYDRDRYSRW